MKHSVLLMVFGLAILLAGFFVIVELQNLRQAEQPDYSTEAVASVSGQFDSVMRYWSNKFDEELDFEEYVSTESGETSRNVPTPKPINLELEE